MKQRLPQWVRPRYWHTRAVIVFVVLGTLLITALEPASLSHRLISQTGGWMWVALLGAAALVAGADIIVNDLLADEWVLPTAAHYRFLVYAALAGGLWAVGGVIGQAKGGGLVMLHYMPLGAWSLWIGVTDLRHKHRRSFQRAAGEAVDPPTMPIKRAPQ